MVLPLRGVAFERYMLADDRPSHPMAFPVRMLYRGRFDEASFRSAVRMAARLHPLLAARIRRRGRDDFDWIAGSGDDVAIDFAPAGVPLRYAAGEQIDLVREGGVRIWVRQGEEGGELRFQFHHSATDGIGAYRFIEDVCCCYAAQSSGDPDHPPIRPLDSSRLIDRARFGLSWWQLLVRLPAELWGMVVGLLVFFVRRPVALAQPSVPNLSTAEQETLLDLPAHTFSVEESAVLRRSAKARGVTLNDLVLRDVFLALDAWNRRHEPSRAGKTLRIMIPMNLRTAGDRSLSATNVVAMVNLDRALGWFGSPAWLLRTLRWEMNLLKRFRFGLAFIRCCALVGLFPGGLGYLARANRCYATGVFSNLGKPMAECPLLSADGLVVAGGVTIEGIESAPPVRPFTAVSLTCLSYHERFTVCMNYDRRHLCAAAAQELLDVLVGQLMDTAGLVRELPLPAAA